MVTIFSLSLPVHYDTDINLIFTVYNGKRNDKNCEKVLYNRALYTCIYV